jgi:hypothetical protein
VDFVDEQNLGAQGFRDSFAAWYKNTYTWDDLGLAFFLPLADFGVDLVAKFGLDFACVACEERKETLRSAVYDVDFVERDRMNDFLSFLDFSFGTLHKFGLMGMQRVRTTESGEN